MSRLGGLFGGDPRKRAVSVKKPVKSAKKAKKPVKKASVAKKGPAAVVRKAHPAPKRIAPVVARAARPLRSVVLFTKPACADCDEAKRLLGIMRRVIHNVSFLEVDVSTKDGEIEALLSGVAQTPAFVINGRLVFRGVLPSKEQLARVINEGVSQ